MSYKKAFVLREERNFGHKIEATFEFIRLTVQPLFKSLLFYTSPFVFVGMFLVANVITGLFSIAINSTEGAMATGDDYLSLGLSMVGFGFLMIFAGTMVMSVVYSTTRVYDQQGDHHFTHLDVWSKVKKVYWPIFGSVFLYTIIFFVIYLIIIIPVTLLLAFLSFLMVPVVYIIMGFFMVVMLTALATQVH